MYVVIIRNSLTHDNNCLTLVITCDEPEVPAGSYVVGYDFNVHSSIEYHCEVGHMLKGEATRECSREGEWSGVMPLCECKRIMKETIDQS